MSDEKTNLSRRSALRLIATTAAAIPVIGCVDEVAESVAAVRSATDPDLLNPTIHWDLVLDEGELKTLAVLCDLIIPADSVSPAASSLGAQDYINEYVSAPYDNNKADLILVRGGLVGLNSTSQKRFGQVFADINDTQKVAICDDIKWEKTAKPQYQTAARFFAKIRNLTATAFYTTEEGMADIGYVGNKPIATFPGPPPEVLNKLGLDAQT